jgi:AcrR family transcriptional regulator
MLMANNHPAGGGLREYKKASTRRAIQTTALRLFAERGFEQTSVAEIAAAAGVSHMTFYRYFPTKEAVVLDDDYDPLIADLIAAQPKALGPVERVRRALGEGLAEVYATDVGAIQARVELMLATPALQRTFLEQHAGLEALIVAALDRDGQGDGTAPPLGRRVIASACAATMSTAVFLWGENGFVEELPDLVDRCFAALRDECTRS